MILIKHFVFNKSNEMIRIASTILDQRHIASHMEYDTKTESKRVV